MYVSSSPALHRLYYSESGYEIRYSYIYCMKDMTVQVKLSNNYVGVVARVIAIANRAEVSWSSYTWLFPI